MHELSSLACFCTQPCSPRWVPWSVLKTTIVLSQSPSRFTVVEQPADAMIAEGDLGGSTGRGGSGMSSSRMSRRSTP